MPGLCFGRAKLHRGEPDWKIVANAVAKSNTKEGEVTVIEADEKWWKKDSYKFCKFPKAFLMNPKYQVLSHGAMVCYVTLFDRMSLSDHNGWIDMDRKTANVR